MHRTLSPYEKTHLLRYGHSLEIPETDTRPVEYITGHVSFCDENFLIDSRALIPRIETEDLVLRAKIRLHEKSASTKTPLHCLEIGTGSGAITLVLAKQFPQVKFTATDISTQALKLAQENATHMLSVEQQKNVQFVTSDLLSNVPQNQTYDLLIANLPYIPSARLAVLDASVVDHEPNVALDGGEDGATLIRRLLEEAPRLLNQKARVLLEVDHTHSYSDLFKNVSTTYSVDFFSDEGGYRRFVDAVYH